MEGMTQRQSDLNERKYSKMYSTQLEWETVVLIFLLFFILWWYAIIYFLQHIYALHIYIFNDCAACARTEPESVLRETSSEIPHYGRADGKCNLLVMDADFEWCDDDHDDYDDSECQCVILRCQLDLLGSVDGI